MTRLRVALAGLALAATLPGCIGGAAPRDHFYRLAVAAPAEPLAAPVLAGTLEVERIGSDAISRGRAVVRSERAGSVEVRPYRYHLWVESPPVLVQRELARYLRAARLAERVVTPETGTGEDWRVIGHLERFDHVVGGGSAAVVELELALIEVGSGRLVLRESYRAEVPGGGLGQRPPAEAFGAALAGIFGRFVQDVAAAR